jgi:predicted anti-sigma-YlaC factor YlaD
MSQCWSEGEIRAYLDRELAPADRERLAAHLGECAECEARLTAVEARAERIATALSALAWDVVLSRPKAAPKPVRLWPRWAGAAAIAATVAMLLVNPQVKRPAPAPVALEKGDFVPLDNEPIDAGLVVRVSLGPNNVQADVVVSADGRARAYRLVDSTN